MTEILAGPSVTAAWGAWTGASLELVMPAAWTVVELPMRGAPACSEREIELALDRPVDAPRLEELAASAQRAVIAVDDMTRPTRTEPIVSRIVSRLLASGMSREAVTVLIATGAHRPASSDGVRLKLGALAEQLRVLSHEPADVVDSGVTLAGHPVHVNRHFLAADLRIGIGGVMPHPFAGYSGGGKIVLPGLSDLESVVRSHKYALMGFGGGLSLEANRFRRDMERAVREIGLHWTVNLVMNARCETAAVVAGDVVHAHRAAAVRAQEIGATDAPARPLDMLVLNAYPKDSELLQVEAALVAVRAGMAEWLRPGAPIVLLGACPDGLGTHQLFGPGGRLFRKPTAKSYLKGHILHVVSPATKLDAGREVFSNDYPYHASWHDCVAALTAVLPREPLVGFAGAGPLHVPMPAEWGVQ